MWSHMDGPRDCHNEWSKTEKDKYHTILLICGILKNGTNEHIYQTERVTEKTTLRLPGREVGGINWEPVIDICILLYIKYSFPGGSDGKESGCNAGDPSSIPGSGRYPGEGDDYPLQYWIANNNLSCGTGNSTWYTVMIYMGKECKKKNGYIGIYNWVTVLHNRM